MRDEYDFSNSNRNGHENKDNKQFNIKKYVPLENLKLETIYGLSQEQMFKVADVVKDYYFKQDIMVEWEIKADEAFVELFLENMTTEYKDLFERDLSMFDDRRIAFVKCFYEEKLIARLKESK